MKALVLFSGGQDSAVALAWALDRYQHVETIGFDYGQAHYVELEQRAVILAQIPDKNHALSVDHLLRLQMQDLDALCISTPLVVRGQGLSKAYVPGRNLRFLLEAAIVADARGIDTVVGGMCESDFRGFPDCRDDTIKAMQVAINLGLSTQLRFEMPLMYLDKCGSWWLAAKLGDEKLVYLIREHSHTCYVGDRSELHPWGYGCGKCDACVLRRDGWRQFSRELAS